MNRGAWVKVALCMPESIISGFVYLRDDERLLDILNGVSKRQTESRSRSLEMVDVEVRKPDGREEKRPALYVHKPSICLAATWEKNVGKGVFAKTAWKEYPFVSKSAVPVRVQLPAFLLIGNMHVSRGQMACHLLEEPLAFLPMTNVEVQPPMNTLWSSVAFVAVNRQQVLSLEQEDIPLLKAARGHD